MLKKILRRYYQPELVIFLLCNSIFVHSQSTFFTGGNICNTNEWHLVYNDEFDGDSLDRTHWTTYWPNSATGDDQCESCRMGKGNIYLDSNVVVSNGTLKLIARRQTVTWFSQTRDYTSGLINLRGEYRFMYGKFETRCRIPYGMGFWPAFWMFGGDDAGTALEIDVFEFGCQKPYHHSMGIGKYHETEKIAAFGGDDDAIDCSDGFHVFSTEWDPFFITFRVDEKEVFLISRFYTSSGTQVTWCCTDPGVYDVLKAFPSTPHNKINVIANLAIGTDGGPFTDAPNSATILPNQFEIDYIRVYQRDTTEKDTLDECVVTLFPNPVHDKLTIRNRNMIGLKIENVLGQVMYSEKISAEEVNIDISFLSKGVYFMEVETPNDLLVGRFIKD